MRAIDEHDISALEEVTDFIESYVRYYEDMLDTEDDSNTDVHMLSRNLPILRGILSRNEFVPETRVIEQPGTYSEDEVTQLVRLAERRGRESVDPNFRYCVVDNDLRNTCYLTDDIGVAMERAARLSADGSMWYVLRIARAEDGYRTYYEGVCAGRHFIDHPDHEAYLHFDYIRQSVRRVEKI